MGHRFAARDDVPSRRTIVRTMNAFGEVQAETTIVRILRNVGTLGCGFFAADVDFAGHRGGNERLTVFAEFGDRGFQF